MGSHSRVGHAGRHTEGASLQLSADIWATTDLSEAAEPTQGFRSSLRISLD